MRKLARFLILCSILSLGTQCISLPFSSLSFFQMVVIAAFIVSIPAILGKKPKGDSLLFGLVWGLSTCLAYCLSTNPAIATGKFLLNAMAALLFIIIPLLFKREDVPLLVKCLIRSQYITILFSIYSIFLYYVMGGIPEKIPLPYGLGISMDEDMLWRMAVAAQLRLALPYSTPPVLSVVMAMVVVLLMFCENLISKFERYVLILLYLAVLFLTGSRSGLLGLGVLIILLWLKGDRKYMMSRINKFWKYLLIPALIIGIYYIAQTEFFYNLIGKRSQMNSGNIEGDRHFLIPIEGIIIWVSSIMDFIFGIGLASGAKRVGVFTEIPNHFMNSYVTLIAERGLMGLFLVLKLIRMGTRFVHYRFRISEEEKALGFSLIVALISSLTYEVMTCYYVLFTIAIALLINDTISNLRPKYKNY